MTATLEAGGSSDRYLLDLKLSHLSTCFSCDITYLYCFPGKDIAVPPVDILISGPSCKMVSGENSNFNGNGDCYEDASGCSGITYQHGFKAAIEVL